MKDAATRGVQLPASRVTIKLEGRDVGGELAFDESEVDAFVARFEAEEPGRHPPIAVRRLLLVETGHRCAVCTDRAPPQFHHIIEFSELKHHDPEHMLAVCGTCHSKMTNGSIDRQTQRQYKDKLGQRSSLQDSVLPSSVPLDFDWTDLRELIEALQSASTAVEETASTARFDFDGVDLPEKNRLNGMGDEYFTMITDHHEPYFRRIEDFLRDPSNIEYQGIYYDLVDALRSRAALARGDFESFDEVLNALKDSVIARSGAMVKGRRALLGALMSFMYANCDIGRKA